MNHSLVCPFLDTSLPYAAGVEFGMLQRDLCDGRTTYDGYVTTYNQEQVTLYANRTGWRIVSMKVWKKDWVRIKLEKNEVRKACRTSVR